MTDWQAVFELVNDLGDRCMYNSDNSHAIQIQCIKAWLSNSTAIPLLAAACSEEF